MPERAYPRDKSKGKSKMEKFFYENTSAAIGLYTDAVNNREMLVIGEPQEIRLFFKNNTPNDRIFVCDRKLGLIADDLNRISDNRKFMTQITEISENMAAVLREGLGNKAIAPYFDELNKIFTESVQRNMIQNFLIYSVSALYNRSLRELNKDLKLSKKALHSLSAELSEQFIAGVDDLLRPFRHMEDESKQMSYWNIKEQIEQNETDSVIHIVRTHKAKGWQTYYIAEESFTAFMSIYLEQLSQANLMVRNCEFCGKLYVCSKTKFSTVCGAEECKKKKHTQSNVKAREKAMQNPINAAYNRFQSRCNNYRRKLSSEQLETYNKRYTEKKKALLAVKHTISEDSPYSLFKSFQSMCDDAELEMREYSDVVREEPFPGE